VKGKKKRMRGIFDEQAAMPLVCFEFFHEESYRSIGRISNHYLLLRLARCEYYDKLWPRCTQAKRGTHGCGEIDMVALLGQK
jgi:hypothetical protein